MAPGNDIARRFAPSPETYSGDSPPPHCCLLSSRQNDIKQVAAALQHWSPNLILCAEREQSTVHHDSQWVLRLKTGRTGSLGSLFIQPVEHDHTKLEVRLRGVAMQRQPAFMSLCLELSRRRCGANVRSMSRAKVTKSGVCRLRLRTSGGWANVQGDTGIPRYILETVLDWLAVTIEH